MKVSFAFGPKKTNNKQQQSDGELGEGEGESST
jgi:hypothetical protein